MSEKLATAEARQAAERIKKYLIEWVGGFMFAPDAKGRDWDAWEQGNQAAFAEVIKFIENDEPTDEFSKTLEAALADSYADITDERDELKAAFKLRKQWALAHEITCPKSGFGTNCSCGLDNYLANEPELVAAAVVNRCPACGGQGWTVGSEAAHHPSCEGDCKYCPIEVQVQVQCPCEGKRIEPADIDSRAEAAERLNRELVEALEAGKKAVLAQGHMTTCKFTGCTCGAVEDLIQARLEFFRIVNRESVEAAIKSATPKEGEVGK